MKRKSHLKPEMASFQHANIKHRFSFEMSNGTILSACGLRNQVMG
jgi:hypothetical protein